LPKLDKSHNNYLELGPTKDGTYMVTIKKQTEARGWWPMHVILAI
jgi:hypothetical protein